MRFSFGVRVSIPLEISGLEFVLEKSWGGKDPLIGFQLYHAIKLKNMILICNYFLLAFVANSLSKPFRFFGNKSTFWFFNHFCRSMVGISRYNGWDTRISPLRSHPALKETVTYGLLYPFILFSYLKGTNYLVRGYWILCLVCL